MWIASPKVSLRRMALHSIALMLSVLILSTQAVAQLSANSERGFKGEAYLSDTIDSVNLYNGNLTLTIPIGQTQSVGGG